MHHQPSPFQNFWQNTTNIQKAIIFTIPIIFIVIIIISLITIFNHQNNSFDDTDAYHINITNFNQTGAAHDYQLALQKSLWQTLQYSNVPYDTNTTAEIRDNTFSKKINNDFTIANFLIDIPSLKQTFNIEYFWPTDSTKIDTSLEDQYSINITCPEYSKAIYPGEICRISSNPYDSIDQYLPYYGFTDNLEISIEKQRYANDNIPVTAGNSVDNYSTDTVTPDQYSGQNFLWITINTCNDPNLLATGKTYLKNWLTTRLVNPDDFLIEYYEYCSSL